MHTIIDEFDTSFLRGVMYKDRELRIIVAEGFESPCPEDIEILGHVIKGARSLETSPRSRCVEVLFGRPIAWQMVDESFSHWDEYEIRDDKCKLQIMSQSRYLDFLKAHHAGFDVFHGPVKHYRIWTENEVLEVVAGAPPAIRLVDA